MFRKLIPLLVAPVVLGAQQMSDQGTKEITLQDAIRLAKDNNAQVISAANSVRSSNLAVRSARAQLYPQVQASLGQSKSAGERLGQSGTLVPYNGSWGYTTNLSISQTLFDGGAAFANTRAQRANVVSAEAGEVTAAFSVVLQVKQQYNAILAAKESEAAARAQLAVAQQQLDVTVAKVNAGAANVADSLNAVVQVGNAQIAILTAQQSLVAASAQLTRVVGTSYLVTATAADTAELPRVTLDSASLMQFALDGPSIRQYQAQLNSANASEVAARRTGYLPLVSANGTYGGSGNGTYGVGPDPFPYSRSLSLSLSYPIFNRYSRENNIATAQINQENANANIKDQKLLAQQTIITQMGVLRTDDAKIAVEIATIRANQEALRVIQQRYELGAGLLLDVLNSQQALITAQTNLIQTRLDLRNARAAIEAFIGRDLP